jgi:hypothetical protein
MNSRKRTGKISKNPRRRQSLRAAATRPIAASANPDAPMASRASQRP